MTILFNLKELKLKNNRMPVNVEVVYVRIYYNFIERMPFGISVCHMRESRTEYGGKRDRYPIEVVFCM